VADNAAMLAKQFGADEEVVIIAVWLHDAISHFDSVPSLLYLAYVERNMDIEEGIVFVKQKLERSYNKLSDKSKEIYREKYQQVMSVLR
jgi:HD superfamily phosphohydrolase YqeK